MKQPQFFLSTTSKDSGTSFFFQVRNQSSNQIHNSRAFSSFFSPMKLKNAITLFFQKPNIVFHADWNSAGRGNFKHVTNKYVDSVGRLRPSTGTEPKHSTDESYSPKPDKAWRNTAAIASPFPRRCASRWSCDGPWSRWSAWFRSCPASKRDQIQENAEEMKKTPFATIRNCELYLPASKIFIRVDWKKTDI